MSFGDDHVGKLLEDAITVLGLGICKSTLGNVYTKSEVIGFGCKSLNCQDNITKTFTVGKLTEHQYAKLIIAGELLDIFVTTIFPCEIVEIIAIEEV